MGYLVVAVCTVVAAALVYALVNVGRWIAKAAV